LRGLSSITTTTNTSHDDVVLHDRHRGRAHHDDPFTEQHHEDEYILDHDDAHSAAPLSRRPRSHDDEQHDDHAPASTTSSGSR